MPRFPFTVDMSPLVLDRSLRNTAWIITLGLLFFAWRMYTQMPETVPMRYTENNEIAHYGSRSWIFALPVLLLFLQMVLNRYARRPNLHQFPVQVTDQNRAKLYRLSILMVRIYQVLIAGLFGYVMVVRIQAMQQFTPVPAFMPYLVIAVISVPGLYFYARMKKSAVDSSN